MQELCRNDGDLEEVLKIKKTTTKTESHFKFKKCKPLSNNWGLDVVIN